MYWYIVCYISYDIELFLGKKQDDLVAMLQFEEDFLECKPLLQEKLEALDCKLIYGVKFHPEFMMVESCYRYDNYL